jgi:hypothetical protein
LLTYAKTLPTDFSQYLQRLVSQCTLIADAEYAERTDERQSSPMSQGTPFPLVYDQEICFLLDRQLNGFPFSAVKIKHQSGSGKDRSE